MSQSFNCPGCGKSYPWVKTSAGQSMPCACGRKFVIPLQPGGAVLDESVDEYELAGEELLEEIKETPKPAKPALAYEPRREPITRDLSELVEKTSVKELVIPLVIIGLGIAVRFCLPMFQSSSGSAKTGAGALVILLTLMLSVATMLVGVVGMARFLGTDLGAWPKVIAKLTALAVIDTIVFAFLTGLDKSGSMQGLIIAFHAVVLVNGVALATLFDFDLQEALFTTAVVGMLQLIGACGVLKH